ncbi:MAG TPA: CFI-box-CTERM domain-containing protein [Nitrososphaera sp.]|nr:CFI-box-CTERM domain-containing protein [Nitrososphaera sp.]
MLRAIACLSLVLVLLAPSFSSTPVSAQSEGGGVGTVWQVETTADTDNLLYVIAESVVGTVNLVEDPSTGLLLLNGTGEGKWTYTHKGNEQCPALSGDGTFSATFSGHVRQGVVSGESTLYVSIMAAPGSDQFGSEIGKYVRNESVICHDEDTTREEPRILAPLIIGPFEEKLEDFQKGVVKSQDYRQYLNGALVKYTVKITPPDLIYKIHGTVKDFNGARPPFYGSNPPLYESKLVLGDYDKIADESGFVHRLSESRPEFEKETTASSSGDATYEFEIKRPASQPFRALVVSLLWYEGDSEFAVTSGPKAGNNYIPIYQAACVDHDGQDCVKWEKTADGFEAEVEFQYGYSSADRHLKVTQAEEWNTGGRDLGTMARDAGLIYANSYRTMKYYESLKGSVGNPLNPVRVDVYNSEDASCKGANGQQKDNAFFDYTATAPFGALGTYLDSTDAKGGTVTICTITSRSSQYDAPINREYHEFGHYLQRDMYYPSSNLQQGRGTPHAGYNNGGTNDSLAEGFAEFVALLIAEHYNQLDNGPVYPTGRNLEEDIRVWGENVVVLKHADGTTGAQYRPGIRSDEEFAVAGLLWDLHDGAADFHVSHRVGASEEDLSDLWVPISEVYNMTKDSVTLSDQQIMQAIHSKKPIDLVELHESFPDVALKDLDMIFINHGAFDDIRTRDLVHNFDESIGETGSTASPARPARSNPAPQLNGSNILPESDSAIMVKITHSEPYSSYDYQYTINATKGQPAYFEISPPYYPSIAEFLPVSPDGKLGSSMLTFNSTEYWNYIYSNPEEKSIFKRIEMQGAAAAIDTSNGSGSSESSNTTEPTPVAPSGCLIATAAFGSELAPQVQFLRGFRDNHILATASGASFMSVFNAWYYSFSPTVADYERQNPWLQQIVRVGIYPLLGLLQVAERAYTIFPGEYGSMMAGIVAGSLIGAVYLSPVAVSIRQVRNNRLDYRIVIGIVAAIAVSVVTALALDNAMALMASTSLLVISTMIVGAVYSAKISLKIFHHLENWRRA